MIDAKVVSIQDAHNMLIKSLIRAHYARIKKTGRLIFIPDYNADHKHRVRIVIQHGDKVDINSGKFANEKGTVQVINEKTGKLKLKLDNGRGVTVKTDIVNLVNKDEHEQRGTIIREGGKLPPEPKLPEKPTKPRLNHLPHEKVPKPIKPFKNKYIRYDGQQWVNSDKSPVSEKDATRIKYIGIPPAWRFVQISPEGDSSLQATGIDESGRTQRKYHPNAVSKTDKQKFHRIKLFARRHKKIMVKVERDIHAKNKHKREAARVLFLIDATAFRVGSKHDPNKERVAKEQAYGASSLLVKHVSFPEDGKVHFDFAGKKGVQQTHIIRNPELVNIIKEQIKGKKPDDYIFPNVTDNDIRSYLRRLGRKFLVKDFRAHKATSMAQKLFDKATREGIPVKKKDIRALVNNILDKVSSRLGNSKGMAKNSYIAPQIWAPINDKYPGLIKLPSDTRKKTARKMQGLAA